MKTRSDVFADLRKFLVTKQVEGRPRLGLIVYRGIPSLDKILEEMNDYMNEIYSYDIDDNDTFIYFNKIAGVDVAKINTMGPQNVPDTVVFEFGRLLDTLRHKLDKAQ